MNYYGIEDGANLGTALTDYWCAYLCQQNVYVVGTELSQD
jgi:hypothetical protein